MLNRVRQLQRLQGPAAAAPPVTQGALLAIVVAVAAAAGAFVTALTLFPGTLVLPATAAAVLLAAAATALTAWIAPTEAGSARVVSWDIAGAMAVIGLCAAAFVGEPEPAVALLERNR